MIRVLLVDDEAYSIRSMRSLIPWARWNCSVIGLATSARQATELMDKEQVDLVFTDIRMPETDGLEFIQQVRTRNQRVRFVIISGHSEFEYARRALQFGVADYLLKPVGVQEIEEVLMRITESIPLDDPVTVPPPVETELDLVPFVEEILESVTRKSWDRVGETLLRLVGEVADAGGGIEQIRDHAIRLISLLVEREIIYANESTLMRAGKIGSASSRSEIYEALKDQILLTQNRSDTTASMNPHVQKILVHLLTHYTEKHLTLKWLSEHVVFMHPDYLGKLFQQETGRSFATHLAEFRVSRACEILKSGSSIAVADLARRIGYGDNVSYFIRQFKRHRGTTPSAYAAQAVVEPRDKRAT